MKLQNHAKTLVGFAAGFICAGLLAAFLLTTQNVQASFRDYTCIKQSMTWDGMATNQVNEDIWVRYKVPSCWSQNGYKPGVVVITGGNVAVTYKK